MVLILPFVMSTCFACRSFGETPADHLGTYEHQAMHVAIGDTSTVVLDSDTFQHVNRTHGKAEELRVRITFLKQSKLFPNFSHAETTDLAGKVRHGVS